jgi:uncharacterized protein
MGCRVVIMAREPRAGECKRRLIPALGSEGAALLHYRLLHHTLVTVVQSGLPAELWGHPGAETSPQLRALASSFALPCLSQRGEDLGARMAFAADRAVAAGDHAIVIGCDTPDLAVADLHAAAAQLQRFAVVIGPAADGGYYLMGVQRSLPLLWQAMAWGGDQVLASTRQRLVAAAIPWHELRTLHDIDRPGDLVHLPEELLR